MFCSSRERARKAGRRDLLWEDFVWVNGGWTLWQKAAKELGFDVGAR
jgi:hypothetical protein